MPEVELGVISLHVVLIVVLGLELEDPRRLSCIVYSIHILSHAERMLLI